MAKRSLTPYDRIQQRRKAASLSERALCEKAGLAATVLVQRSGAPPKALSAESIAAFAAALGCTVGELFGEAVLPERSGSAGDGMLLSLDQLGPSVRNPRQIFDGEAIEELAESIEMHGLQQPLLVRRFPLDSKNGVSATVPLYEIVAGERRYRALRRLAALGRWRSEELKVPCRIVEADDATVLELALIENLQRQDLTPLEEAEGFARLRKFDGRSWSTADIAKRIGKTQRYVQQRLALVEKLSPEAREALRTGAIDVTQARELTAAAPEVQARLVPKIKSGAYHSAEDLRAAVQRWSGPAASVESGTSADRDHAKRAPEQRAAPAPKLPFTPVELNWHVVSFDMNGADGAFPTSIVLYDQVSGRYQTFARSEPTEARPGLDFGPRREKATQ